MEFVFSDPKPENKDKLRQGIEHLFKSVVVDFKGDVEVRYENYPQSEKTKIILTPINCQILSISRVTPQSRLEAYFVHEEIGNYTELNITVIEDFVTCLQEYRIYHRPKTDKK